MTADVRMNYESMEAMSRAFEAMAAELEASGRNLADAATRMEGGALRGKAGDIFVEAIRSVLLVRMAALGHRMTKLSGGIQGAVSAMRAGVSDSERRFDA
jgi:hypothetical protein